MSIAWAVDLYGPIRTNEKRPRIFKFENSFLGPPGCIATHWGRVGLEDLKFSLVKEIIMI